MCDFQIFVKVIGKGSDPPGGGTLYFLSLIINYLSCCLSFSPPISPRLNFFVLHWYTTLCQYCKDTDFCFENQRKFQEMFNGMLPVCFSQEVLLYQIPDIEFIYLCPLSVGLLFFRISSSLVSVSFNLLYIWITCSLSWVITLLIIFCCVFQWTSEYLLFYNKSFSQFENKRFGLYL